MAVEGAFLEAHSYAGGLRHTPLTEDGARPGWAPPADSVGWRDEFLLEPGDVVVEFNQREAVGGGTATWLGVYQRSIDTRLGDRGNHAGVGVWLRDRRVVDPVSLLQALGLLASALAKLPQPESIAQNAAEFAQERFLGSYVTAAERLPLDWQGAPASGGVLVDTDYRFVGATTFEGATGQVAEEIASLSLDWSGERRSPRTLILVSGRSAPPTDRTFLSLPATGTFLADLLEHLPAAFGAERDAIRAEAGALAAARTAWEAERRDLLERLDAERREAQLLDNMPPSLEGIAAAG